MSAACHLSLLPLAATAPQGASAITDRDRLGTVDTPLMNTHAQRLPCFTCTPVGGMDRTHSRLHHSKTGPLLGYGKPGSIHHTQSVKTIVFSRRPVWPRVHSCPHTIVGSTLFLLLQHSQPSPTPTEPRGLTGPLPHAPVAGTAAAAAAGTESAAAASTAAAASAAITPPTTTSSRKRSQTSPRV